MSLQLNFKNMCSNKKIVELIQGIRSYISRNRSSISNEDLVLLEECIETLERISPKGISLERISKVILILERVLSVASDFIDNLH